MSGLLANAELQDTGVVPDPWARIGEPERPSAELAVDVDGGKAVSRPPLVLYLNSFDPAGTRTFPAPLKIEFEGDVDGRISAIAPALRVAGIGDGYVEALSDLFGIAQSLLEEFEASRPEQLDPSAKKMLAQLRIYFR